MIPSSHPCSPSHSHRSCGAMTGETYTALVNHVLSGLRSQFLSNSQLSALPYTSACPAFCHAAAPSAPGQPPLHAVTQLLHMLPAKCLSFLLQSCRPRSAVTSRMHTVSLFRQPSCLWLSLLSYFPGPPCFYPAAVRAPNSAVFPSGHATAPNVSSQPPLLPYRDRQST